MSQVYNEYSKARVGWFFGLTGWQAGVLAACVLPMLWALGRQAWASAGLFLLIAALVSVLTVVPVRGRSAIGWIAASVAFSVGGLRGWTAFQSRAAHGQIEDLAEVDLPGALAGIAIHDGPPIGLHGERVAIIQNHTMRTWAVTAAIVHPGIGMDGGDERARMGRGLANLVDQAERTELIDEILFMVRTVPDDAAERDQYTAGHRRAGGHPGVRAVNDELAQVLTGASVRTEAYVTLVVPESRIARPARETGGGVAGRAQVLYGLMGEVETELKGGLGASTVTWLTSPHLAIACRTGFASADRTSIIDALTAHTAAPQVNPQVPWAMAGPCGADPVARHYSHDAWNSISSTIKLPPAAKGVLMGALAPVLTPASPAQRRSLLVVYPVMARAKAAKSTARASWAADMGEALRHRAGVAQSTTAHDETSQVRGIEAKISRGRAMTQPYAVCTVTCPKTVPITAAGRSLDASIRAAGFAPMRLDLSHDVAFAASVLPLGVSLTRRGQA